MYEDFLVWQIMFENILKMKALTQKKPPKFLSEAFLNSLLSPISLIYYLSTANLP